MTNRHDPFRYCQTNIPLLSLKVSNLYINFYSLHVSPNKQYWMRELCMLSLIQSHIATAIGIILTQLYVHIIAICSFVIILTSIATSSHLATDSNDLLTHQAQTQNDPCKIDPHCICIQAIAIPCSSQICIELCLIALVCNCI